MNCTIVGNNATSTSGAGVYFFEIEAMLLYDPQVGNSILHSNGDGSEDAQLRTLSGIAVRGNIIEDRDFWPFPANIDATPDFKNAVSRDYRLNEGSPGIDAGINSDVPADCEGGLGLTECDVDEDECGSEYAPDDAQRTRIREGVVDIGAHEYLCIGDVTDSSGGGPDGVVDVFDLLELLATWGNCPTDPTCTNVICAGEFAEPARVVDVFDLLELLAAWGPCGNPLGFIPENEQDCFDEFYPNDMESLEACLEAVAKMQE